MLVFMRAFSRWVHLLSVITLVVACSDDSESEGGGSGGIAGNGGSGASGGSSSGGNAGTGATGGTSGSGTGGSSTGGTGAGGPTQCSDGIDNDGDGKIDLWNDGAGDPGCAYAEDDKECQRPECLPDWPGSYAACPDNLQSNTTYSFVDCSDGIYLAEDLENVRFYGSRFRSNAVDSMNVQDRGVNTVYDTCLFEPSQVSAPPTSYDDGYQFGLWKYMNPGFHMVDCELWGWGNGIQVAGESPTAEQPIIVEGSWFHDARDDGGIDHTDGILSNDPIACAASNPCLVVGNVIASVGNTNGLALQPGGGGAYSNWKVRKNHFSGFGYTVAIAGDDGSTGFGFTDNTASTAFTQVYGFTYPHDIDFTASGNYWRRNVRSDGQFWLPSGDFAATDYANGNAGACDNGLDDDGDGTFDFGSGATSDSGCSDAADTSE